MFTRKKILTLTSLVLVVTLAGCSRSGSETEPSETLNAQADLCTQYVDWVDNRMPLAEEILNPTGSQQTVDVSQVIESYRKIAQTLDLEYPAMAYHIDGVADYIGLLQTGTPEVGLQDKKGEIYARWLSVRGIAEELDARCGTSVVADGEKANQEILETLNSPRLD